MLTAMSRRSFGGGVEALLFLLLALCVFVTVRSQVTHPDEVSALRAVKSQLKDPVGNLDNWKNGDPCNSNWTGIFCVNGTLADGYLHIQQLELLNMNLSGTLAPELGNFSYLTILDFMWNYMEGSIPKEIGNLKNLKLLLLNGNKLTGSLPEELGYLPHLDRIQIDQNKISGPLPKSFANLNKTKHFHMNNNSISGEIPRELSRLPSLVHFLLDNNNLTGSLPTEFSELPNLLILQVDNNNFDGTEIPASFANMTKLLKLSLRNCSLQGPIPDLSKIPGLGYIDLSFNQLSGPIPSDGLSADITTIKLSNNSLNGTIPENFARLPYLQELLLDNNSLSGAVPSAIWQNRTSSARLNLDFRNNQLTEISGSSSVPPNVTLLLQGNPSLCANTSINRLYCGSSAQDNTQSTENDALNCPPLSCLPPREYAPAAPGPLCYCAVPFIIEYRLKSPGFMDFLPYKIGFERYLTRGLSLGLNQLNISSIEWQQGKRLKMDLRLFPLYDNATPTDVFNVSELKRIRAMFTGWNIPDNDTFGPYELLGFNLLDPYKEELFPLSTSSGGLSKGTVAGITVGSIAGAILLSAAVSLLIIKMHLKKHRSTLKTRKLSRIPIKIDGVRSFTYEEMSLATSQFSMSAQIGQGGYGKVYKGVLADGLTVAIKRAQEGSLQGEKEFCTEIELLSRLHHRHLVSLIGYCDEEGEQMLVYEFMPNGTLRDHLSARAEQPLSFAARLRIALGSARGILYLHSEADPPVIHRDIKAANILLDSTFTAKVADFGLSRLAPIAGLDGIIPGHVSTVVKGTPGYLDPEYFLTHKLTDKSDVYSFGVVLLELLTGMHPISHGKNIVREVNSAYQVGDLLAVVDQRMGACPPRCAEMLVSLALGCCDDETDKRPTMARIVRELEILSQMASDSDTELTSYDSLSGGAKGATTPSSSSVATTKSPFVSYDHSSGSYLDSGTFPFIPPR